MIPGDVVVLKNGGLAAGPKMTVERIIPMVDGHRCVCVWFDATDSLHRAELAEAVLETWAPRPGAGQPPAEPPDPRLTEARAKGGRARRDALSPERRSEIAREGASARWGDKPGD